MSKIELQTPLLTADDKPMLETVDGKQTKIIVRLALMRALAGDADENGVPLKGEAKLEHYDLWKRIKTCKGDVFDCSPEDLVLLRKVCLGFPVLIAGQLRDLLV